MQFNNNSYCNRSGF